jgi:hypothetical protein
MAALYILFFHHLIRFIKNRIYHKMQREKLYNLHKTAYFIVALFVFKMGKILSDQRGWRLYPPAYFFSFYYFFVVARVVI